MKIFIILSLSTLSLTANAGWWRSFCERYIIGTYEVDDFEFNEVPERDLKKEIDRLQIKVNWGSANPVEMKKLGNMRYELWRRSERHIFDDDESMK